MTSVSPDPGLSTEAVPADRRCPFCEAIGRWEPLRIREMMFGTREVFDYLRCLSCGSIVITTVPDDLARHYPPAYYANSSRVAVTEDPAWKRRLVRSLAREALFGKRDWLLPLARRFASLPAGFAEIGAIVTGAALTSFADRIVDVGCGAEPYRSALLHKVGFDRVLGIEPYIPADLTYRGVTVRKGDLSDVDGFFALIMFHHSLEHIADPLAALEVARRHLAPGGSVLVRMPIADGPLWRRYGTDWVELDAPRHLALPSMRGLEMAAARIGFEIVRMAWESGDWEFIASEQYQRDVGMYEPSSWFVDQDAAPLTAEQAAAFRDEAKRLNNAGEAGRAAIWLRPRASSTGP
jgi:SAM-dependent methyltransferase